MKHENFGGNRQNDSQEFIRLFLEDINNELNEVENKPEYRELNYKENLSVKENNIEYKKFFSKYENSIVIDSFYIQILNTYICDCGYKSYSFQKFFDIPLLIPENVKTITLTEILDLYFGTEEIEFNDACLKCNKKLPDKKEQKISIIPEILILSLQRIDKIKNIKIDCIVNFDDKIDISKYIEKDCGSDNMIYNLYGVINHQGSLDFGHYYSYIKNINNDNIWTKFDDIYVSNIGTNIDNLHSYILFYIKNVIN